MPTIGWSEMLMLAVVAIVVVGPKELPRLMRVAGHWMGKARAAAREFQQAFDDMAHESEVEEMRRKMDNLRSQNMFPDIEEEEEDRVSAPRAAGNGAGAAPAGKDKDEGEAAPSGGDPETDEPENRPVPSH
ncbi:MAG: Sec-independent protein translocase protein TatB [Alphaproteobacteria bacterium]